MKFVQIIIIYNSFYILLLTIYIFNKLPSRQIRLKNCW